MFVRTKTVKTKTAVYEYYQLVESVYKNGRSRQKVLVTLGRVDKLDRSRVDEMIRALSGYADKIEVLESMDDCHKVWSRNYGDVYVMEKLWREIGLDEILGSLLHDHEYEFDVVNAIKAMVFNRSIDALSKLSSYEWMNEDVHLPECEGLSLHHLYRALDFLVDHKDRIESRLYDKLTAIYSMDVSVVFYDCSLVDMYGESPDIVRYSRKKRPQFLVSLILSRDGFPIGHEVLPGNTADIETVRSAIRTLKQRYCIGQCIFVCDRGMVSRRKLEELNSLGFSYIVGVRLNQWKEVREEVLSSPGRYAEVKENLFVKEVYVEGRRYLICYNPFEAEREKRRRQEVLELLAGEIDGLDPDSKRACELYSDPFKGRYLRRLKDGSLRIDRTRAREDEKYDGKYVLLTSEKDLSKQEISTTYRRLSTIEQSFRSLKSVDDLEPVYHHTSSRIRAHVFVCILAHLLERAMESKLEAAELPMTAPEALKRLGRMKISRMQLKKNEYLIRTDTTAEMNELFQALHYRPPSRVQFLSDIGE